jgi:hypothetical protein
LHLFFFFLLLTFSTFALNIFFSPSSRTLESHTHIYRLLILPLSQYKIYKCVNNKN